MIHVISNAHRYGVDQFPLGPHNTACRNEKFVHLRPPSGLHSKLTRYRYRFLLRVSGHQILQRCSVSIIPGQFYNPVISDTRHVCRDARVAHRFGTFTRRVRISAREGRSRWLPRIFLNFTPQATRPVSPDGEISL